jgi:orotate phosphoribosyltransferase
MEAAQALRELMQLSSQIRSAVVLESNGSVLAASSTDPAAVDALTASTLELVAAASELGTEGREVTRVEVELDEGAFFVVRDGGRTVGAVTGPNPTSGLVVYDLRTCAQAIDAPEAKNGASAGRRRARNEEADPPRRPHRVGDLGVEEVLRPVRPGRAGGGLVCRRLGCRARARLARLRAARRSRTLRAQDVTHDELGALLVERALLEGDFVLRSGRRSTWYLDKYRFETEPEILRALGTALGDAARECEPDATRLAGPALGAVALAASAAMASGLPFIIVRGETKEYGTAQRIEGPFEPGDLVCLLEDVVTSGGALAEAVSAVRDEGLVVRHAVCVVDREEGGSDALARLGVRLRSLFRASELLELRKIPGNRHG